MSAERMDEQFERWDRLSDRLFGEPSDVGSAEAEELLSAAGLDPQGFKNRLCHKMLKRAEEYSRVGRPLPPLLRQAIEELRPDQAEGSSVSSKAQVVITRLLKEIEELPKRLSGGVMPTFSAAYRNKKELSARDKRVLDRVAEDLRKSNQDGKR